MNGYSFLIFNLDRDVLSHNSHFYAPDESQWEWETSVFSLKRIGKIRIEIEYREIEFNK